MQQQQLMFPYHLQMGRLRNLGRERGIERRWLLLRMQNKGIGIGNNSVEVDHRHQGGGGESENAMTEIGIGIGNVAVAGIETEIGSTHVGIIGLALGLGAQAAIARNEPAGTRPVVIAEATAVAVVIVELGRGVEAGAVVLSLSSVTRTAPPLSLLLTL